jgi:hypothetical protein
MAMRLITSVLHHSMGNGACRSPIGHEMMKLVTRLLATEEKKQQKKSPTVRTMCRLK